MSTELTDPKTSVKGLTVNEFQQFLDHVMKNFSASFPYGLSKTEVTRLTFLAWCLREAQTMKKDDPVETTS